MPGVSVGITDVRTEDINAGDTHALAAWAVLERIDMLTTSGATPRSQLGS